MICLTREEIADYVQGRLPEPESESAESHLENCPKCQQTAEQLDAHSDSLLRHLKVAPEPAPSSDTWRACLANLRDLPSQGDAVQEPAPSMHEVLRPTEVYHYRLEQPLGQGGMGVVYRSWHPQLHRPVAIKILNASRSADEASIARFQREMRAAGGLDHPGIVRAVDAGYWKGTYYLVMELIDGVDLSRLARHLGPLDVRDACEIIALAADAVEFAHQHQIIHRDLKPSNLMLATDGSVRVLDFGLARFQSSGFGADATTAGRLVGTLDYLSPEQASGDGQLDARSDLYALGATLFRLLAGRPPHGSSKNRPVLQHLQTVATCEAPRLTEIRSDLPEELVELVANMLATDPDARPKTAAEVAKSLRAFSNDADLAKLATETIANAPTGAPTPFPSDVVSEVNPPSAPAKAPPGSKRGLLVACASLFVGLAIGLGAITLFLKTGEATVEIESDIDDVSLELIRDGKVAQSVELKTGTNTSVVRVGKYELKIGAGSDRVRLDQESFELMRGDHRIVRVTMDPLNEPASPPLIPDAKAVALDSAATVAAYLEQSQKTLDALLEQFPPDHPTVVSEKRKLESAQNELMQIVLGQEPDEETSRGRTYKEWTNIVLRETDPRTIVDAIGSLASLSKPSRHDQTIETLIKIAASNEQRTEKLIESYIATVAPDAKSYIWGQLFPAPSNEWALVTDAIIDAIEGLPYETQQAAYAKAAFGNDATAKRLLLMLAIRNVSLEKQRYLPHVQRLCDSEQPDDVAAMAHFASLHAYEQPVGDQQVVAIQSDNMMLKKVVAATMLKTSRIGSGAELGRACAELEFAGAHMGYLIGNLVQLSVSDPNAFDGSSEAVLLEVMASETIRRWEDAEDDADAIKVGGISPTGINHVQMIATADLLESETVARASKFLHQHLNRQLNKRASLPNPEAFGDDSPWLLYTVKTLAALDGKLPAQLEAQRIDLDSKQGKAFASWSEKLRSGDADASDKTSIWIVQFPLEAFEVIAEASGEKLKTDAPRQFLLAMRGSRTRIRMLDALDLGLAIPLLAHIASQNDNAPSDPERANPLESAGRVGAYLFENAMDRGIDQLSVELPVKQFSSQLLAIAENDRFYPARGMALRLAQAGGSSNAEIVEVVRKRFLSADVDPETPLKWSDSHEFAWMADCLAEANPSNLTAEELSALSTLTLNAEFPPVGGKDIERTYLAMLKLHHEGNNIDSSVIMAALGQRTGKSRPRWPSTSVRSRQASSGPTALAVISSGVPVPVVAAALEAIIQNPPRSEPLRDLLISKQKRMVSLNFTDFEVSETLIHAINRIERELARSKP